MMTRAPRPNGAALNQPRANTCEFNELLCSPGKRIAKTNGRVERSFFMRRSAEAETQAAVHFGLGKTPIVWRRGTSAEGLHLVGTQGDGNARYARVTCALGFHRAHIFLYPPSGRVARNERGGQSPLPVQHRQERERCRADYPPLADARPSQREGEEEVVRDA